MENLLTEKSKNYGKNGFTSQYKPIVNIENHDTIGLLAIDEKGNISSMYHIWYGMEVTWKSRRFSNYWSRYDVDNEVVVLVLLGW